MLSLSSLLTFQFLTDLIVLQLFLLTDLIVLLLPDLIVLLLLLLPEVDLTGVRAVSPVSARLDVIACLVSLGAAPQSVLLVVVPGTARVQRSSEGEGKLARSPVLRVADRPPGPRALRDRSEPGQVGEKVGVHPRPTVPRPTLTLTEADDPQQDKVVVKPLSHQAATRVSTAGVRNSLAAGVNQCSLRALLVTVKLPGRPCITHKFSTVY